MHSRTPTRNGAISILMLWFIVGVVSLYLGSFIVLLADDMWIKSGLTQQVVDAVGRDNLTLFYQPLISLCELLGIVP